MRSMLLASVLTLALAPFAYAQTLDFSAASGRTSGTETSSSTVHGTGSNMSGGMVDAQNLATDMSASQIGPHGLVQTGTTGSDESSVAEMTFDVGSGHDSGTATGSGSSSGSFAGLSIVAPHRHH